jgi:uncharacterized membrane protein YfhO
LRHTVWKKFTSISEVVAASIIRAMMEAASISETVVNFYQTTRCNSPEDTLAAMRTWNLMYHLKFLFTLFHARYTECSFIHIVSAPLAIFFFLVVLISIKMSFMLLLICCLIMEIIFSVVTDWIK